MSNLHPKRLFFGVEFEWMLSPKNTSKALRVWEIMKWDPATWNEGDIDKHRMKLRQSVLYILNNNRIHASDLRKDDWSTWTVDDEPSIRGDGNGRWRIELVSPTFVSSENWSESLTEMFSIMKQYFDISVDDWCSTHVHVSPGLKQDIVWTVDELKAICKAAGYFDRGIINMLPPDRKWNSFAYSNFSGPSVTKEISEVYRTCLQKDNFAPLNDVIDGLIHSPYDCSKLQLHRSKYYLWNFLQIADDPSACGTVEFRGPPGVDNSDLAIHWSCWILFFFSHAIAAKGNLDLRNFEGHTRRLRRFLISEWMSYPATFTGTLDQTRLVTQTGEPRVLGEEDKAYIEKVKRQASEAMGSK